MQLILWRHAEAENGYPDVSRALTNKGIQQAKKMAAWLKPQLPSDTQILVSPAVRTRQTADALNLPYTCVDALATDGDAKGMLSVAKWPNNDANILIIGHQPTLGLVAAYCMSGTMQYWSVKKGAVWWINRRIRHNETQSVLKLSISPDVL